MSYDRWIADIESEWSPEDGFLWKLRQGQFELETCRRVLEKLTTISIEPEGTIPKRLVSLLWYIPLFMGWQVGRVEEGGADPVAYQRAVAEITNEIERLLGTP